MPDNFTYQWKGTGTQWLSLTFLHGANLNVDMIKCTLINQVLHLPYYTLNLDYFI